MGQDSSRSQEESSGSLFFRILIGAGGGMNRFHITASPGIVYLKKIQRHQWVESSRFSGFKYLRSTYSPIFRVRCIIILDWRLSRVTFTVSSLPSAILPLANSVRCFPPFQDLSLLLLFRFWFEYHLRRSRKCFSGSILSPFLFFFSSLSCKWFEKISGQILLWLISLRWGFKL